MGMTQITWRSCNMHGVHGGTVPCSAFALRCTLVQAHNVLMDCVLLQFDYLCREKIADGPLIAKWRKPGYEILCSMLAIQKVTATSRASPAQSEQQAPCMHVCKRRGIRTCRLEAVRGDMWLFARQGFSRGAATSSTSSNVCVCLQDLKRVHRAAMRRGTTTSTPPRTAECPWHCARRSSASHQTCRRAASHVHQVGAPGGRLCEGFQRAQGSVEWVQL